MVTVVETMKLCDCRECSRQENPPSRRGFGVSLKATSLVVASNTKESCVNQQQTHKDELFPPQGVSDRDESALFSPLAPK
jgi:hypothetical protein